MPELLLDVSLLRAWHGHDATVVSRPVRSGRSLIRRPERCLHQPVLERSDWVADWRILPWLAVSRRRARSVSQSLLAGTRLRDTAFRPSARTSPGNFQCWTVRGVIGNVKIPPVVIEKYPPLNTIGKGKWFTHTRAESGRTWPSAHSTGGGPWSTGTSTARFRNWQGTVSQRNTSPGNSR